jgi:hypothetical protein
VSGASHHDQLIDSALWLDVQGDEPGAIELLKRVLREDPANARAQVALQKYGVQVSPPGLTRKPSSDILSTQRFAAPTRQELLDALTIPEPLPDVEPEAAPTPPAPPPASPPRAAAPPPRAAPSAPRAQTADGRYWALEVLTGPHTGTSVPLARRPLLIGRGLGVLDVDNDPFMSSAHASFFQRGNDLWISDGASASGTWVSFDGPQRLNPNDAFSVGLQRFKYLGPLDSAPVDMPWPYGAPRPAASWKLEHTLLGNRPGKTWVLRGAASLGRSAAQITFHEDDTLEPLHAELRPAGTSLELIDRSRTKSTFVALPSGGERRLIEGTRIRLGSTLFRITAR